MDLGFKLEEGIVEKKRMGTAAVALLFSLPSTRRYGR
jgi:hypothetical protein